MWRESEVDISKMCQNTPFIHPGVEQFESAKVVFGAGGKGATGERLCFTHSYLLYHLQAKSGIAKETV